MKAIAIVTMPKHCAECELCAENHCHLTMADVDEYFYKGRPNWCPLKPMPERKEHWEDSWSEEDRTIGWIDGWNACLEEITGDTE